MSLLDNVNVSEPDWMALERREYLAGLALGAIAADPDAAQSDAVGDLVRECHTWAADEEPASHSDPLASLDPVDLDPALNGEREPIEPTVLARNDGARLFYAGQINGLHAKDGVGKSWVALFAAVEQLGAGRRVLWIDCEDPNETAIVARLRALGVAAEVIRSSFRYMNPSVELTRPGAVARIIGHIDDLTALVVVDSIGEAFSLDGVNENNDDQVGPWYRRVLRPLAETGVALVTIDHATNANDDPLRPSGSKRKRAAVTGAQYEVRAPTPFAKEHGGKLSLRCAKDRHGNYRRGDLVAEILVSVDGGRVRFEVNAPAEVDGTTDSASDLAASAAFDALVELGGGPVSQNELLAQMKQRFTGSSQAKRAGIDRAVRDNRIVETPGARNARLFSTSPDLARPRPAKPAHHTSDLAHLAPPYRGEERGEVSPDRTHPDTDNLARRKLRTTGSHL